MNSRLDSIQAAVLLPKFKAFVEYELNNVNRVAEWYTERLKGKVITPTIIEGFHSSWAQYTILLENEIERNNVQKRLKDQDIPTMVYYPKPLHKQIVYKDYNFNLDDLKVCEDLSKKVLSLPMHPYLTEEIINEISNKIIESLGEYRKNGK